MMLIRCVLLCYCLYFFLCYSTSKIRRKSGKSVGSLLQYYLLLDVRDEMGRELEVITPWQGTVPQNLSISVFVQMRVYLFLLRYIPLFEIVLRTQISLLSCSIQMVTIN